jgi:hypothetical protein
MTRQPLLSTLFLLLLLLLTSLSLHFDFTYDQLSLSESIRAPNSQLATTI